MADFYVMYQGTQYDCESFAAAKAKAVELGADAVMYVNGACANSRLGFDGITTVITANATVPNSYACGYYGSGTAASTNTTVNGGSFSGWLIASAAGGSTVTGDSVLTINGGNFTYGPTAIHTGTAHNVTININGGKMGYVCGFNLANGGTIDGNLTYNFNGGEIGRTWLISGYGRQHGAITGGLYVNLSGSLITGNFRTSYASGGGDTIGGGSWFNLTGGTIASNYIYGTSDATQEAVTGGVHFTIDGYEAGSLWVIGTWAGTADFVEMNMKSGKVNILCGGPHGSNQTYDVDITMEGGVTNYITGAAYQNFTLTGDVNINITGGTVTNTFNAAGNKAEAKLIGDVVTNISGDTTLFTAADDFNISGSGLQEGNATMNISGGTFTGTLSGLGKRATGKITGDMTLNMTGGLFTNTGVAILGGSKLVDQEDSGITGDVELNISGGSIAGSIYLLGGTIYTVGDSALNLGAVGVDGTVSAGTYASTDASTGELLTATGYLEGNRSITVNGTVIGGDLSGIGTGTIEMGEGEFTNTLTVGSAGVTVAGAVSDFDTITIAAAATINAGSVTAAAITAEAATADGAYKLATGFAAQASTITVVNGGGSTLGSVTLSDSITSGEFTAGGATYKVGLSGTDLYLCKNADIPGPGPIPPTPTETVAEVILTITDPNHDYFGATGGWKVQNDQSVAWQDITTLGAGYSYLGLGATAAQKAMPDIYVYNAEAKYVAAYVTDDTGAVASFESIFTGEAALMQVGIADFNADGVSDLLLRTADGFVGYYANGAFAEVQGLGTEWTVAALGDVDGNGRADVIIAHEAGYVGAYLIGNDGSISWADLGNLDSSTAIVGAGDVNGDGTDDVIIQVGANYYGAWVCGQGAVTGYFGIGEFDATVQDIADYNADGTDDLLFRTSGGVVGAALITGADATTWAEYGALGAEWSTKGVGIL